MVVDLSTLVQETPPTDVGPLIRLLICYQCSSIDELPDYAGSADHDHLLQIAIQPHHDALGTPHRGQLMKVPVVYWSSPWIKDQILESIRKGSTGLAVQDSNYYTSRSQFAEDAMSCYKKHLKPKGSCPEYNGDHKRLLPDTKEARKDLGLVDRRNVGGPRVYLCQFCPVASFMQHKNNQAKGLDK